MTLVEFAIVAGFLSILTIFNWIWFHHSAKLINPRLFIFHKLPTLATVIFIGLANYPLFSQTNFTTQYTF